MRTRTTPRLAALVAALAVAAPSAAVAHPFVPRASLSAASGPSKPDPLATSSGPSKSDPLATSTSPGPWTPPAAPAPAPSATSPTDASAPVSSATSAADPPAPADPAASAAPDPSATSTTEAPLPPHPVRLNAAIDAPVIALSTAIWAGTYFAGKDLRWAGCGSCDPSAIGGLDRRVLGNENLTAAHASDALLYTAVGLPFVADLTDALVTGRRLPGGVRHAAGGWARDAVVLFEVLSVNVALTNLVKYAVRRPRPYSYDPDSALGDVTENEARLSFYSGHASTTFAMMTAWATLFTYRHPRARAAAPVWIAAIGLATATSLLRVVAGKHFWTDIATGALAGSAVGILVPTLHRNPAGRRLSAGVRQTPRGGAMLTLSGQF